MSAASSASGIAAWLVGSGFAGWLIDALIASALLMAAVLLVRGPVRRAFGPQLAYALWALPALRLVLPPLPSFWSERAVAAPIRQASETITILIVEPVARSGGPSLAVLLVGTWAVGAAAFVAWHLIRHARFCRAVVRNGEPVDAHDGVRIIASAAAPGPIAFGMWRRYVAFPRDFAERYDADERALALAHELGHHARRDLHANWAGLVVLALHWFNPLAWRAFHAFRADQELANDARVLAGRAPAERHAYGRAIVKAAHGGAVSAACHLHTISDLKGRLRMLTTSRASRRRLATGSAAVTLLVAGGLGLTASSSAAEQIRGAMKIQLPETAVLPAVIVPATEPQVAVPVQVPTPPAPTGRATKHVVVVRDGKTRTYDGAEADKYIAEHDIPLPPPPPVPGRAGQPTVMIQQRPNGFVTRSPDGRPVRFNIVTPDVRNADCPGDSGPATIQTQKRGRQTIVVCQNRIRAMTVFADRFTANAGEIERGARLSARSGLAVARTAIETDRNLTDEQRRDALAGIADAEAELNAPVDAD